jgi:hypothetical protein
MTATEEGVALLPPDVVVPSPFSMLASLYTPADDATSSRIVEADNRWTLPTATDEAVLVFGRMPVNRRPGPDSILPAIRREVALIQLRTLPRFRHVTVHRLGPIVRPGFIRQGIRTVLLGSALAEVTRGTPVPRVIDAVVLAAGATPRGVQLRPSGNGSALAHLTLHDGTLAELRVAAVRHPTDLMIGFRALEALAAAGVDRVPRPLASGTTAGAMWTTETSLDGRHTKRLGPGLYEDLVEFCLSLPESVAPARALQEDIETIAQAVPATAGRLRDIRDHARRWLGGLPATMLHGDLWLNNVLVQNDRLSGVFDWDTWHVGGPPGVDLMNILATTDGSRRGADFGLMFTDGFWRADRTLDRLAPYFTRRLGAMPTADQLKGIAVAWWAGRVVAAMYRIRRPLVEPAWRQASIEGPIAAIEELARAGS